MIIGVVENPTKADDAVDELQEKGIDAKDISVIMKSPGEGKEVGRKGGMMENGSVSKGVKGATYGGVIGGLGGLLLGIAAIAIPGFGALLFVGPLATALGLGGAAATTVTGAFAGAATGGLVGVFEGFGVSHEEAEEYQNLINQGAVVIAAPATSENKSIIEGVFAKYNATNMRELAV